jgi:TonB family protein
VFHVAVLVFLIFFGLHTLPKQEEGILVNLGNSQTGWGQQEPKEATAQSTPPKTTTPPPTSKPTPVEPTKEQVKTQDYDEAPEIKSEEQKKREEAERKRVEEERRLKAEQDRIKKEEEERRRKEEEERLRKEAEERKRQEELERQKKNISNNVSNAFGKGTGSSTSEGENKGSGNQGYVTGDPNSKNRSGSGLGSKGNGADVAGRSLQGSLPQPEYDVQEYGTVVVEITVDKRGNVVSAKTRLKGTDIQNRQLWKAAENAAKRARFNEDLNAAAYVKGTITYTFELK